MTHLFSANSTVGVDTTLTATEIIEHVNEDILAAVTFMNTQEGNLMDYPTSVKTEAVLFNLN